MDFSTLENWGYLAIAFFSLGGSMLIVAAAGVFAFLGHLSLPLALLVAAIFNFIGDNFLFYLARYHNEDIKKYTTKYRRQLALTRLIMRKYGTLSVFIQKYLYGVKTLIPIVMSLSGYNFKKFIFLNIFASIIFVVTIGLSAYYFSDAIISVFETIEKRPYLAPLILAAIVFVVWKCLKKFEKKR